MIPGVESRGHLAFFALRRGRVPAFLRFNHGSGHSFTRSVYGKGHLVFFYHLVIGALLQQEPGMRSQEVSALSDDQQDVTTRSLLSMP